MTRFWTIPALFVLTIPVASLYAKEPKQLPKVQGLEVALIGIIDVDGDHKSDLTKFRQRLKASRVKRLIYVNESGKRFGGKLDPKIRFLVVGKIPKEHDAENAVQKARFKAVKVQFLAIRREARENGVKIISLNDFLRYIHFPRTPRGGV